MIAMLKPEADMTDGVRVVASGIRASEAPIGGELDIYTYRPVLNSASRVRI